MKSILTSLRIVQFQFILIIISFTLALSSCNNKSNNDEAIVAPEGMSVLNLEKFGKPFAIFVPDTTKAKLVVSEQSSGALEIKVGGNFAISVFEEKADIELKKTDITSDEVNKLKRFIVEEPAAIFWESAIMQPEFHFLINLNIAERDFSLQDIINPEVEPFGKETMQRMFESCKNIKEVKKNS